jgi:hypothetical protein
MAQPTLLWAFRVARELGMLVSDLLDRMSALELAQWVVFLQLKSEDFDDAREAHASSGDVTTDLLRVFGRSQNGKPR